MDIKDENENENNRENGSEHESTSDDIPLWLQGLEERDPDETKPISPDPDRAASWIREIEAPQIDQSPDETDKAEEVDAGVEAISEEKMQEDINFEDFTEDQMTEISLDLGQDQQGDVPESESEQNLESEPTMDESASHEGFVDISGIDISEPADEEDFQLDDEPLREGDLPEWLQEMIAETEEEEPAVEPGFIEVKAPDELEPIPSAAREVAESKAEEPSHELPAEEVWPVIEPEALADIEADYTIEATDEETSPLELPIEEEAITPPRDEERPADIQLVAEQEPLLELAKEHINQGAIDEALPLLRELLDEPGELEGLRAWLDEIAETETAQNSELMEIIGDVAMIQDKPDDAFHAYAKAINILLLQDEVFDEIG